MSENHPTTIDTLNDLIAAGLAGNAIPLRHGDKIPADQNWPNRRYSREELIERVGEGANLGLRLDKLVVIDVEHSDVAHQISRNIQLNYPDAPCRLRPGSGSRAFLFAAACEDMSPWKIIRPAGIDGDHALVAEVLMGPGRQLHVAGPRNDKGGVMIEWQNLCSVIDLPILTAEELQQIGKLAVDAMQGRGIDAQLVRSARPSSLSSAEVNPERMSPEMLGRAISHIPNDGAFAAREDWVKMLHALFSASGGSDWGRDVAMNWSYSVDQTPGEPERVWASINPETCRAGAGYIRQQLALRGHADLHDEARIQSLAELFGDDLPPLGDKEDAEAEDDDDEDPDEPIPGVYVVGQAIPDPAPSIVEELLPAGEMSFIGGQSGAGKSFVAVDLAISLAAGLPFFGRATGVEQPDGSRKRAGVIYVAAESPATLPARLAAAMQARFIDQDEELPVFVDSAVPDLLNPVERKRYIKRLKKLARRMRRRYEIEVGLVVVDTLAAACSIKDENDNSQVVYACKAVGSLGKALNATTLVLHHYGKQQEGGLRGASALRGAAESVIAVLADRSELTGRCTNRRLVHTKSKDYPEGASWAFDLETIVIGERRDGSPHKVAHISVGEYTAPEDQETDAAALVSIEQTSEIQTKIGFDPKFSLSCQAALWAGHVVGDVMGLDTADQTARSKAKSVLQTLLKHGALKKCVARNKRRGVDVTYVIAAEPHP